MRLYLQDIGRVDLLTQEQELTLARLVQRREQLLREGDPGNNEPNESELDEVAAKERRLALHRGKRAKERMIQANLRLVVSVAKKYQRRGMDLLDMVQEGTLGLERAVERFDPTRGVSLQHIRLLVDSPGHHPGPCQPEPHYPATGAHHRKAQPN